MSIWFESIDLDRLNHRGLNTMVSFLGIEFVEWGEDYLVARMPVDARVKQPRGFVHGGANVVLAESVASAAANLVVDPAEFFCVGLEINANHVKSVLSGSVLAKTKPVYLGKKTQVWTIDLFNDAGQLTCVSRMTAAILKV